MNLANNLKKIRKDNNLSQEQLAEKLGVSRQSVSKWESNQAYPEMDKVLQLCKMFDVDVDELLNQNLKEVINTKQSKNNINKFIDDFLDYITKTIDMFSTMKFKDKIKCIFEQCIIIGFLSIVFLILGVIGYNIVESLFFFLPHQIYYAVYNVIEAIYIIACLILGGILLLYIFKVRYLDYYVVVRNSLEEQIDIDVLEEKDKVTDKNPKEALTSLKQEKIIIRDPKHSGYKFISGLLKGLLFILKMIALFIAGMFCITLILLVVGTVLLFLFIKTEVVFVGGLLTAISLITVNLIILILLYNFIVSRKTKKNRLAILFVVSLFLSGIGIGIVSIGITKFNYINNIELDYYVSDETFFKMKENLFIESYYGQIEYIETDIQDIKIITRHSSYYEVSTYNQQDVLWIHSTPKEDALDMLRTVIADINNNNIIDYSNFKIYVYASKENINIMKSNRYEYYNNSNLE